jgi:hypothetical protein
MAAIQRVEALQQGDGVGYNEIPVASPTAAHEEAGGAAAVPSASLHPDE